MSDLGPVKLVLFLSRRISLKAWDAVGLFGREVARYRRSRPQQGGITFVTCGEVSARLVGGNRSRT